jgi:hypothetical protein
MIDNKFNFNQRFSKERLKEFSEVLQEISSRIGFKVSSRGWGYLLEQAGYIDKSQFDKVEKAVNDCRKQGFLPVDFVAEEAGRMFKNIIIPSGGTVKDTLRWMLNNVFDGQMYYQPDWWEDEEYYIQVVVEKVDLVTLFENVCLEYKIPIANAKGWQSISQRAEYARRFKEAEQDGKTCVLLYCGDHDPDGIRIDQNIRENLKQIKDVYFEDGESGYDPENLIIDRFGLNYDFIIQQGYIWIDNLITGSGSDLSSSNHRNHKLPYVQKYLKKYGVRKCESNAVVTTPDKARDLIRKTIEDYLGEDCLTRFREKREKIKNDYNEALEETGVKSAIEKALNEL